MAYSDAALLAALTIFTAIFSAPIPARADFVLHHWENHYEYFHDAALEGDLLYYSSTQNYDPNGNLATPTGSNNALLSDYHRLDVDVLGEFGLFERLSLFGRVSWARFQVDDSTSSSSTYGFADQTVGGDYRVVGDAEDSSSIALDLQAQADLPAYSNSADQVSNSPYQGDDSVDVSLGGFLTIPVKETDTGAFSLLGGLAYTTRASHYSAALPWNMTASYSPKPTSSGFLGAASALGVTSLKTDSSALIAQEGGFSTGSGGDFITNALNPSLVVLRGQAGYQLSGGDQVLVAVEQSVWGQDSPMGTNLIFGFKMNLGPPEGGQASAKSARGFEEYTLDARVARVNDRLNLLKIDKGSDDGVVAGQVFDIFSVGTDGLIQDEVARCRVTSVKSDEAALTIIEYFKEVWINEGFIAKRLAQ